MKAFILFIAMVLGYSTVNMFQLKVNASTYKQGIDVYLQGQAAKPNSVLRKPAIIEVRQ